LGCASSLVVVVVGVGVVGGVACKAGHGLFEGSPVVPGRSIREESLEREWQPLLVLRWSSRRGRGGLEWRTVTGSTEKDGAPGSACLLL